MIKVQHTLQCIPLCLHLPFQVCCAWESCKARKKKGFSVDGGKGGGLGFAELGGRRAGVMGDKNKEDAG